jgi:hypothetical protein
MAHRPPGRPKASDPRDIKITVRLTEREADLLQRLAKEDSLSVALRKALDHYIGLMGGASLVRDTERALIRRELRKAKRPANPEGETLAQVFDLDDTPEPISAPPTTVLVSDPASGKTLTIEVTKVPDPYAGKTFQPQATPLPDPSAP